MQEIIEQMCLNTQTIELMFITQQRPSGGADGLVIISTHYCDI